MKESPLKLHQDHCSVNKLQRETRDELELWLYLPQSLSGLLSFGDWWIYKQVLLMMRRCRRCVAYTVDRG